MAARLAVGDAGVLDGTGEEREGFGEGRLPGVGVGDDGEGATASGLAADGVGVEGGGFG